MRIIHNEITRIERSHDNLWSLREDLHTKFDTLLKPHLIDGVLDAAAAGHEGNVGRFRKIFIEKQATFSSRPWLVSTRTSPFQVFWRHVDPLLPNLS